ncbi:tetratricopeptide repeat protein [Calothrix sp. FACHB-1219]|uniref:CHAT domain-containing protein n=1 Tax=unclassified Calothrix TaxID=2619626 RepID=UPI001686A262|nr:MULTISPECIES: tetratricopeptide repeat protein [unclassified Calothrix]MBD2202111.1 tetratricopeptide repeat protein [Calothrix sp. FACHB-168]MBD2217145.1 tetratricopeptide repeat protein [Calothrix sp. FACHB-1219]
MLRRLFQWLKKLFQQHPFSSQKAGSINAVRGYGLANNAPPELTNADLELLFTQLLEGVQQARGRQWALKYLERMEHRIPDERWIDWLLSFGERLLNSPAPNHQLAARLIQLGELGIGRIGDLAYDIGLSLLKRNSATEYEEIEEPDRHQHRAMDSSRPENNHLNSPGQELIRNLGDRLWDYDDDETEILPIPEMNTVEETWTGNFGEVVWEYQAEDTVEIPRHPTLLDPGDDDEIANLFDLFSEPDAPENEPTTPITNLNPAKPESRQTPQPEVTKQNPPRQESRQTPPPEVTKQNPPRQESRQTPPPEVAKQNPPTPEPSHTQARDNNSLTPPPETPSQPPSETGTWDTSLNKLEPSVAQAFDELLVRLDQSTSLVQELASELAIQRQNSQIIPQPKIDRAQAWFYQGLQQARTGDLAGAIASYNAAIEIKPDAYEYWFNRALTLFHLENFTEAIASYDCAIELKPDFHKAWYNRGGILGELGDFAAAVTSFEQVIALKPDFPEAWSSRGLALMKLGQLWEAIASYDQALVLQPLDPENWYYRGIALGVSEQYQEAIASYDKALEIEPNYYEVWIDRGVVLFNLGQWSEAIASWDKALSIHADFYLAWYNRGVALDNLGRREEAIDSYRKAIAIKPDFHVAWYNQAVALFYLEKYTEAIASYDSALQIKADYWEAWIGRGTAAGHINNPDALSGLFTNITAKNSALKQSGYEGKLASYEAGLKYVRPDTHPEGWGRLHLAMANSHYDQGKKHSPTRSHWQKAVAEYNQALLTLTSEDFPQLHLEVLQYLTKTLVGLGQTAQAQEFLQYGSELLQQLVSDPTRPDDSKKQLALKFAGLRQLIVDLAVDYGDLIEAWEIAEQGKNACLNWQLAGWQNQIDVLSYPQVQQLLNPQTAIIYWHISPAALHTFVLKDQAPSPILIFTPMQDTGVFSLGKTPMRLHEVPLPEAVRRFLAFESWLEDWNQQYQEYCSHTADKQNQSNHSWRMDMGQRLLALQDILNISSIIQELEGISHLILIPHRDLQKLPLHVLFENPAISPELLNIQANFTISYLPSVYTGLTGKSANIGDRNTQLFLSVENPHTADYPPLKFAKLQAEIVSQMFPNSHRIQGGQANKNTVQNALEDEYNIFHFTGSIIHNASEPKKSELALTDTDKLTLEEIYQQSLVSYNLVNLSACETITNHNYSINSEYVSLVHGFLSSGASQVISTLWTVESIANDLAIVEFYRRLQPNKSAATTLAEVTAWLRELTARELTQWYEDLLNNLHPEDLRIRTHVATQMYRSSKLPPEQKLYSHPYYWAAFTITGRS